MPREYVALLRGVNVEKPTTAPATRRQNGESSGHGGLTLSPSGDSSFRHGGAFPSLQDHAHPTMASCFGPAQGSAVETGCWRSHGRNASMRLERRRRDFPAQTSVAAPVRWSKPQARAMVVAAATETVAATPLTGTDLYDLSSM
jgi:hypothetical protein